MLQVGAREDCWPIENVSKVSIITGEFNGHSVSGLIHYCWAYFLVCMGFDLLQAFVLENIEVTSARLPQPQSPTYNFPLYPFFV